METVLESGNSAITNGKNDVATAANGVNGNHSVGEHEEMQYLNLIRKIIDSGKTFTKFDLQRKENTKINIFRKQER